MRSRNIVAMASVLAALAVSSFSFSERALAAGANPNETVDTSVSAAALAQSLVGPGVAIENVQYTGAASARGTFAFSDSTVVGTAQGVILSSGDARDVVGPNTSDSFSTDWTNTGDADLTALSGFPTFDAAVLEFDFVPDANQVSFQYAFASDEYPEWVTTQYNDVFAFFINGVDCALVRQVAGDPNAPFVPVAINNINNSNPVINPPPPPARPDLFRENYFNDGGASLLDLEMDGITRIITCQSAVNPGQTNHMKLAIADASDGIYDSAVFIEAGSLVSNENPTADLGLDPSSGTAPLVVTATVEGEDPNGLPLSFTIDWGDGTSTPSQPLPDLTAVVNHTYESGGTFIVTLTVSNGTLSGTDQEDVEISGPPATVPSATPTATPIVTAAATHTPTQTPAATASTTASATATHTAIATFTASATATQTSTFTATDTHTATVPPTPTPTDTPIPATSTATATETRTVTATHTATATLTHTATAIATATNTATATPSPTPPPVCAGDINGDHHVDAHDLVIVARALFTVPGRPRWNPDADLNHDGRVDLIDLFVVIQSMTDHDCR